MPVRAKSARTAMLHVRPMAGRAVAVVASVAPVVVAVAVRVKKAASAAMPVKAPGMRAATHIRLQVAARAGGPAAGRRAVAQGAHSIAAATVVVAAAVAAVTLAPEDGVGGRLSRSPYPC